MKKAIHICSAVLMVLALLWCTALPLMSVFVGNIDGSTINTALIAFVLIAALFAITGKKKFLIARIFFALLLTAAVIMGFLFGYMRNPYSNSDTMLEKPLTLNGKTVLTREQADKDIDELIEHLKRVHPEFINGIPDKVYAARLEAGAYLDAVGTVTVDHLNRAAESIVSVLNDAHTAVYRHDDAADLHYIKDYAANRKKGYRIVSINGKPLIEVLESNKRIFSYEFPSWAVNTIENYAISEEMLRYMGYDISDGISLTWSNGENKFIVLYDEDDFLPYDEYMKLNAEYYEDRDESFVKYETDKENDYALLTLSSCNYNDEYVNTLKKMFSEVKNEKIGNVIVDLRSNGGGNSLVANEFIKYLDTDNFSTGSTYQRLGDTTAEYKDEILKNERYSDYLFKGNVYVLTDDASFSSAMLFAWYISDNGLGKIVGEAPGNSAIGYGDTVIFVLDNSLLNISVSSKYFERADKSKGKVVTPDYQCDSEAALEKVISIINADE